MAGPSIGTWVKVRNKSGRMTARVIANKFAERNYKKGEVVLQSEYNAYLDKRDRDKTTQSLSKSSAVNEPGPTGKFQKRAFNMTGAKGQKIPVNGMVSGQIGIHELDNGTIAVTHLPTGAGVFQFNTSSTMSKNIGRAASKTEMMKRAKTLADDLNGLPFIGSTGLVTDQKALRSMADYVTKARLGLSLDEAKKHNAKVMGSR